MTTKVQPSLDSILSDILASASPEVQALASQALRAEQKAAAKTAKAVETPEARDLRLRNAALKAWETRRNLDPTAPSRSAKLAWETRRSKDAEQNALASQALSDLKALAAQRLAELTAPAPTAPQAPKPRKPRKPRA